VSAGSVASKKLPRTPEKPKNTNSVIIPTKFSVEVYEEKAIEWQNFTGFLAALGGCCLQNAESNVNTEETRDIFQVLAHSNKSFIMADRFISDMTDMLVSDNVYISEGVKDTLGNDLSPALYVLLFNHLERRLSKCFDANNSAIRSPQNKMFIEQSVLVLRLILDRLVGTADCLLNIEFSTLVQQFADYLNKVPNTYITLRIKVKMCLLVEAVMHKKEQIVIRDEMRLRNRLLEICVEWTSDSPVS
jgi:neurofibromin 1